MKKLHVLALSIMTAASFSHLQATGEISETTITETHTNWAKTLKKILLEPGIKLGVCLSLYIASYIKGNKMNAAIAKTYDEWATASKWAPHYNQSSHFFEPTWVETLSVSEKDELLDESMKKNMAAIRDHMGEAVLISMVGLVGGIGSIVYTYKFFKKLFTEQEVDVVQRNLIQEEIA